MLNIMEILEWGIYDLMGGKFEWDNYGKVSYCLGGYTKKMLVLICGGKSEYGISPVVPDNEYGVINNHTSVTT